MTCPNCGRTMYQDHTGTNHAADGVTYDQVAYHCTSDNWWVTVESPRAE